MTREEAISKAINIVSYFEAHFAKSKEAREDAANIIEALEQAPCEDAVSRKAVLDLAINVPIAKIVTEDKVIYRKVVFVDEIEQLPPVTPQHCEDVTDTNVGNMDLISRQGVAEVLLKYAHSTEGKAFAEFLISQINDLPSVKPQYTDAEIQKMQDLEFAEIQKAYEIGKDEGSSEKPNKWIPVSERLPEWHWETAGGEKFWVGERVLACVKEADEYYDLVGVATYGPYGWESSDEGFCSCLASKPVIAWMPLPDPYKASPTGAEGSTE